MRVVVSLLSMLLMVCNFANAYSQGGTSTRNETYVCSVIGWNNVDGSECKFHIYLKKSSYSEPCYVGREVDENGEESSFYNQVSFVVSSTYSGEYTYCIKSGFIGAYLFNSNRLDDKYVNGDRASVETETFVCSVIGWNNAIGERQRLNIYLFRASYTEPYYVAREVDEDNKVGFLKGDVRFVANPQYSDEYTYCAKIGFVGAYFFNTSELQEKYVKD